MSFLAPLFMLGVLAVALPIIFHLIRRTTREQTIFSSLMFLMPTPPRLTRKSRLDNILLLILRCVVLGLLSLGFARPFLKRPMAAEPDSPNSTKVIVLVDTSASMKRENLWNQAMDRAEAALRRLNSSDQVALFTFDQQAHALVSFSQWASMIPGERVSSAMKRLQEIKPTWGGTSLGNALTSAADAFSEADKKEHLAGIRRIIVVTDLQEGSRLEGLQGYEWPRGAEVMLETISVKRPTNAGLQLMSSNEDAPSETAGAALRVRIANSTDATREQFKLRWPNGTTLAEVYVPPGQSRTLPVPDEALKEDRLLVEGDDADFDNTLHLIPPKADEVKILFLGEDGEKDSTQSLYYLKRAFQNTLRQKIQILAKAGADPLTAEELVGVQFIVVSDVLPEARLASVQQLLNQGKTVLFTMKTADAASTLAKLAGVPNLSAVEARLAGQYAMIGQVDFQHPLFTPFADPRFSDFTKIHFWKHRRLDAGALPKATVLARFDNREPDPAILQVPVGPGTLLVLTFGWFPTDSEFARSSKFVPLLYSMLELSGAIKAQTSQYLVGDPVDLSSFRATQPLAIRKPDGTEVQVPVGARFTQTDQPGVYTITSVQPPARFAVNLGPEESKTSLLPVETLQKLGVPLKTEAKENPKQAALAAKAKQQMQAVELESRQKLWRWLIVTALVVLMVETWLAGRITRRATLTESPT